jgi:hypothetical protein
MKRLSRYLPLLLVIPVLLLGCAAGDIRWNESNPAGFWAGLWHGMISVVTLIISLFSKNVKMYECFNNGGWYVFGFLLGVIIIWGGGCGAAVRRSKSSKPRDRS